MKVIASPNGREVFYRTEDQHIMVVPYTVKGDVFVADKPRLWSDKRLADVTGRNLDITPEGKRFIVAMRAALSDDMNPEPH
jgi:eukaryotic-like serine/threonine-protein kinase